MRMDFPELRLVKTGQSCWTIVYLNGYEAVGEVYRPFPKTKRTGWSLLFRGEYFLFDTRTEALEHVSDALDPAASSL